MQYRSSASSRGKPFAPENVEGPLNITRWLRKELITEGFDDMVGRLKRRGPQRAGLVTCQHYQGEQNVLS